MSYEPHWASNIDILSEVTVAILHLRDTEQIQTRSQPQVLGSRIFFLGGGGNEQIWEEGNCLCYYAYPKVKLIVVINGVF